jgi:hypothetical protein
MTANAALAAATGVAGEIAAAASSVVKATPAIRQPTAVAMIVFMM